MFLLFFFYFIISFISPILTTASIISLTTSLIYDNKDLYGSVVGSTRLYLRGSEFPTLQTDVAVYVGPNLCILYDLMQTRISCFTGASATAGTFDILVYFKGVKVACNAPIPCQFTYNWEQTPQFWNLFPSGSYPDNETRFWGIEKVNSAKLIALKIGDYLCDILNNSDNDNNIVDFWYNYIKCHISPLTPSGLYNSSMQVTDSYGLAQSFPTLKRIFMNDTIYNMAITPVIQGISSNIGSRLGQIITIWGKGFQGNRVEVWLDHRVGCQITYLDNEKIECILKADQVGGMSNVTEFIGGSGLDYRKYSLLGQNVVQMKLLKGFPNGYIYRNNFLEMETPENMDDLYGQRFIGFFKAPVTGSYKFYISGDQSVELWLSNSTNSSLNLQKIAFSVYPTAWRSYYENINQISQLVNLTQNSFYYMEVYHAAAWGNDHVTVSVEVPSNQYKLNSIVQQQTFTILASINNEIIKMLIYNVKGGTFSFTMVNVDSTGKIIYSKTSRVLPWNVDEFNLAESLNNDFDYYNASVQSYCLTYTGIRKADSSLGCEGYEYQITYNYLRPTSMIPTLQISSLIAFTTTKSIGSGCSLIQTPSSPVRGTFLLKWKYNSTREIAYNALPSVVREEIKLLPGISQYVDVTRKGNPDNGCSFTITFNDMIGETSTFLISNYLKGGTALVKIGSTVNRIASMNQLFEPIPFWMFHTKHEKPQIIVKVNDLYATCPGGACNYSYIDNTLMPFIDSYNITSYGLDLYINTSMNNLSKDNFSISFAEALCSVTTLSYTTFIQRLFIQCLIDKNMDFSLKLVAGYQFPLVHLSGIGYLPGKNYINQSIFINMSISSISPNLGTPLGGQTVNITGKGFPYISSYLPPLQTKIFLIYFGDPIQNHTCTIISLNNSALTCLIPAYPLETTVNISIYLNSMLFTTNTVFTYSLNQNPTISGFYPKKSSPVLKRLMNITGQLFGSKANVYLTDNNGTNIYECSIVFINNTLISCVLGGGNTGIYRLKVVIDGKGIIDYSNKTNDYDIFQYKISILSIYPTIGSVLGGTILSIIGENFSPNTGQNQIFLNDIICDIIYNNNTYINCTTRAIQYELNSTVTLYGRLIEKAICIDNTTLCLFNYSYKATPYLTNLINISYKYYAGDKIGFIGILLTGDVFLYLNQIQCAVIAHNDTYIALIIPDSLIIGLYNLTIRIANKGYVLHNNIMLNISIKINEINVKISYKYGVYLTIKGSALRSSSDLKVILSGNDSNIAYCNIIEDIMYNLVKCDSLYVNETVDYKVIVKYDDYIDYFSCSDCHFYVSRSNSSQWPMIYSMSNTEINEDLGEIVKFKGFFNICQKIDILMYNEKNKSYIYVDGSNIYKTDNQSLIFDFSRILAINAAYRLKMNCFNNGFSSFIISNMSNIYDFPLIFIKYIPKITPILSLSSYIGGSNLYVALKGLNVKNLNRNDIRVCDIPVFVRYYNNSHGIFETPKILTKNTINTFKIIEKTYMVNTRVLWFNDGYNQSFSSYFTDTTVSYRSMNPYSCYIGFDAGVNIKLKLKMLKMTISTENNDKFNGTRLESSNDNLTYIPIYSFDSYLMDGYYIITLNESIAESRYFRIKQENTSFDQYSSCFLQNIEIYGYFMLASEILDLTIYQCKISIYNETSKTFSYIPNNTVVYQGQMSGYISSISPMYASHNGNTSINIQFGSLSDYLLNMDISVYFDNILCITLSFNKTNLICALGQKFHFKLNSYKNQYIFNKSLYSYSAPSINIYSNSSGRLSNGNASFLYIDRWSEAVSWGGESPPRDGDSVYIPANQSILLDISPPLIKILIIEGTLIIEDLIDITLQAEYIIIRGGSLKAGSDLAPYLHKLSIILIGTVDSIQLPQFGNKVLVVFDGNLELIGQKNNFLRGTLNRTANYLDNKLYYNENLDWMVGDCIVVTSSSINPLESETVVITSINITEKSFNIKPCLTYTHSIYSISMLSTQILLLSRNILISGNPIDSNASRYGGHLYMYSTIDNSVNARLINVECRFMGKIIQNAITLRMVGDAYTVFLSNLSINNGFSRGICLIGGRRMEITNNLIYKTYGHGISLQTGVEMNNRIVNNIVISTYSSWSLLISDITPAGFYISNLYNYIEDNIAIGGDYYGFWLNLKNYTNTPFFLMKICPNGIPGLSFKRNMAFSYRIGLYIDNTYIPRTKPCYAAQDNYNMAFPFINNPSIQVYFDNFVAARNREKGVFLYKIGAIALRGFQIIENYKGIDIRIWDQCFERMGYIESSVFIGYTQENKMLYLYKESIGLITPKSDGVLFNNLSFINYDNSNASVCIRTCSGCEDKYEKLDAPGGKMLTFSSIFFKNVTKKVKFCPNINDFIQDLDGSLINFNNPIDIGGWVLPYLPHLSAYANCLNSSLLYDGYICTGRNTFKLRTLTFFDLRPDIMFSNGVMKIEGILSNFSDSPLNQSFITSISATNQQLNEDGLFTIHNVWIVPVVTGSNYKAYWTVLNQAADFDQVTISTGRYFNEKDQNIHILFNFTSNKQKFQITRKDNFDQTRDLVESLNITQFLNSTIMGSYINDISNQSLLLSVYKNDSLFTEKRVYISRSYCLPSTTICSLYNYINNTSISNKSNNTINTSNNSNSMNNSNNSSDNNSGSSSNSSDGVKPINDSIRYWSEPDTWSTRKVPLIDEDVTIPLNIKVLLDIDPPNLGNLIINGDLIFDIRRPITTLKARNIYIYTGKLLAGNETMPFGNRIDIILLGSKISPFLSFSPIIPSANKAIIVASQMLLYGLIPNTITAKLVSSTMKGSSLLSVNLCIDWNAGDYILIAPSELSPIESEERRITYIYQNCSIIIDTPLNYSHYGSNNTYNSYNYAEIDMRTKVSLLSRNIRIFSEENDDNWGCRIIIYKSSDPSIYNKNWVILQGIELRNAGQIGSNFGAIGFEYSIEDNVMNGIYQSTIVNTYSHCIKVLNSRNIFIQENLLINCKETGILLENINLMNINILSNIVIGVTSSYGYDGNNDMILTRYRVAGLLMNKISYKPKTVVIRNNKFIGSIGYGAILFANDCQEMLRNGDNGDIHMNNEYSSNKIGLYIAQNSTNCVYLTNILVYKNEIGIIGYPAETLQILINSVIFAENLISLSMNIANKDEDDSIRSSIIIEKSTFFGLIRENCEFCYINNSLSCSNLIGILMGVATQLGKDLLLEDPNDLPIYKPLSNALFNQKYLINNSTFMNFNPSYMNNLQNCENNFVFQSNGYVLDRTTTHILTNIEKYFISSQSFVNLPSATSDQIMQLCGNISCTGHNTALIKDLDGSFFSNISVVTSIALQSNCMDINSQNAYQCSANYSVFSIESLNITENDNKIFTPIQIFNEFLMFSSISSGYKNFDYYEEFYKNPSFSPIYPRFSSIVPLYTPLKVKFPSEPPQKMKVSLENSLNPNESIFMVIFYSEFTSVRVTVNNILIKPYNDAKNSTDLSSLMSCGSHYWLSNGTIEVLINSEDLCIIYLEVIDSVKISIGFDMTIEEFYTNDGFSLFIDKISQLLGISTDRLRIAGIRKGSVIIDFFIDEDKNDTDKKDLKKLLDSFVNMTKDGKLNFLDKTVLDIEYSYNFKENLNFSNGNNTNINKTRIVINNAKYEENNKENTIIAISVSITGFFIVILLVVLWLKCRKRKKIGEISLNDDNISNLNESVSNNNTCANLIEARQKGVFIFDMKTFQTKNTDVEMEGIDVVKKGDEI